MYMNANEPYQRVDRPGVAEGAMWGALKWGAVGAGYSVVNEYMLHGDLQKMKNIDPHLAMAAEKWRAGEVATRAYEQSFNGEKAGKNASVKDRIKNAVNTAKDDLVGQYNETRSALTGKPNESGTQTRTQRKLTGSANPLKQNSPIARLAYNSAFAHGLGGNARRVGMSMLIGGFLGAMNNQTNGIIR